jgi:hypothetical protein
MEVHNSNYTGHNNISITKFKVERQTTNPQKPISIIPVKKLWIDIS